MFSVSVFGDRDIIIAIVYVCIVFVQCVLYEKRLWSRIPDPRNAMDLCFGRRIEMIESADVSKSMRMQYARQYARANSKCSALFRR